MADTTLATANGRQAAAADPDAIVHDLPPSENKRFYPALDGLRALAVLMVFFEHYGGPSIPGANWGWAGVDIFFVLSGFLITGILYDTRNTAHRFRNFYARRTLRIFPLYYGVLLFGLLLTPIFHWLWNPAWLLWFVYLGNYARFIYLHNPLFARGAIEHLVGQHHTHMLGFLYLGHFWSLCVEEQFYLVWPCLVFLIRDRVRLRNLCITVCVLTLVARIICVFTVPHAFLAAEFLYRITPLRADALLLGGLVALSLRGPNRERLLRLARPLLLCEAALFVVFEVLYPHVSGTHQIYDPNTTGPVLSTIGFTLVDLFAATLILAILQPSPGLYRLFNLKSARQLGQISYGFYVYHDLFHYVYLGAAHHIVGHNHWAIPVAALIGLVCTTAIAYGSFRYFESPFLKLKRYFVAS